MRLRKLLISPKGQLCLHHFTVAIADGTENLTLSSSSAI